MVCIVCMFFPLVSFANDDTSIIDALQEETSIKTGTLQMQTFESCEAFEDVMGIYIKEYWKSNW